MYRTQISYKRLSQHAHTVKSPRTTWERCSLYLKEQWTALAPPALIGVGGASRTQGSRGEFPLRIQLYIYIYIYISFVYLFCVMYVLYLLLYVVIYKYMYCLVVMLWLRVCACVFGCVLSILHTSLRCVQRQAYLRFQALKYWQHINIRCRNTFAICMFCIQANVWPVIRVK